jgi:CPA1 family monovalent cation:H+ antiporter
VAAEQLGVSGVIATVTTGIYLGRLAPRFASPRTRVQSSGMWEMTRFILNGLIFILIGLQLPGVLDGVSHVPAMQLLGYTGLVSLTALLVRFAGLIGYRLAMRLVSHPAEMPPRAGWQHTVVLGWSGMRGVVSLAAALALPATTYSGAAFPDRSLVIFLTFTFLLVTLLGQGLTLPLIIRALGVTPDGKTEREEAKARLKAARAAMARLDQLVMEDWVDPDEAAAFRARYQGQADHARAHYEGADLETEEERIDASRRLRRELLEAESSAVVRLRDDGYIADDVLRRVQSGLDLQSVGLEAQH